VRFLWHALNSLCTCQRAAWGLMYSKIRSWLALECAQKLIYVRCTGRQCSKSAEADLQAAGKLPAAL